jgi:hypothetical protein
VRRIQFNSSALFSSGDVYCVNRRIALQRYEYGHQTDSSFPTIMKSKILLLLVALPGAIRRVEGAVSTSLTHLHVRRNETTDTFITDDFSNARAPNELRWQC